MACAIFYKEDPLANQELLNQARVDKRPLYYISKKTNMGGQQQQRLKMVLGELASQRGTMLRSGTLSLHYPEQKLSTIRLTFTLTLVKFQISGRTRIPSIGHSIPAFR
jgi:hypothetical protein